jgi:tRNA(Arg) A34 adenosine deaminase TadA
MCLTRILYAGIGEVIYIHADDEGGMVQRRELLPPAQRELANITRFRVAEVSEPVRELAARLSVAQLEQKRQALMAAQGRV